MKKIFILLLTAFLCTSIYADREFRHYHPDDPIIGDPDWRYIESVPYESYSNPSSATPTTNRPGTLK